MSSIAGTESKDLGEQERLALVEPVRRFEEDDPCMEGHHEPSGTGVVTESGPSHRSPKSLQDNQEIMRLLLEMESLVKSADR